MSRGKNEQTEELNFLPENECFDTATVELELLYDDCICGVEASEMNSNRYVTLEYVLYR